MQGAELSVDSFDLPLMVRPALVEVFFHQRYKELTIGLIAPHDTPAENVRSRANYEPLLANHS